MNLLKRIKNLYNLSEIETKKGELSLAQFQNIVEKMKEKPKLAQIIRRENIIDKVLKNDSI